MALLLQGLYPPAIRVAMLSLQDQETREARDLNPVPHNPCRPMRIVAVLEVAPVLSPRPRVIDGVLSETHFDFDAASRAALDQAHEWRGADGHVTVVTVAPRYAEPLMRRALASGADRAVLIETDDLPADIHAVARMASGRIALEMMPFDVVMCGENLLAGVLAGHLGVSHLSRVESCGVRDGSVEARLAGTGELWRKPLPVVLAIEPTVSHREWTLTGFGEAMAKPLDIVPGRDLDAGVTMPSRYVLPAIEAVRDEVEPTPEAAAQLIRKLAGLETVAGWDEAVVYDGVIRLVGKDRVPTHKAAVYLGTVDHLDHVPVAAGCAGALMLPLNVVVLGDVDESRMRTIAGRLGQGTTMFVTNRILGGEVLPGRLLAAMQAMWKDTVPDVLMADNALDEVVARFAKTFPRVQARYDVARVSSSNGEVMLAVPVFGGRVQRVMRVDNTTVHPLVMTFGVGAEAADAALPANATGQQVCHMPLEFACETAVDDQPQGSSVRTATNGEVGIADATVIIDVGYAIRNRENFDAVIVPLERRLREMGVRGLAVGGTRKVVEELKLLGSAQQIGQTGTAVNPRLIISIGVSGAPQHMDYIGDNATIIAINKDPEAPIMTLNKRRARPRIVPLVGDLYEIVPGLTRALEKNR
jgi:electron transfer flavoprotein alpha subunit/electron transfer flavoprotein alpha/beta subunit